MAAFDHLEWTYGGHLHSFSASGGGNFNKNFPKIQMRGGLPTGLPAGGSDWYISMNLSHFLKQHTPRKDVKTQAGNAIHCLGVLHWRRWLKFKLLD